MHYALVCKQTVIFPEMTAAEAQQELLEITENPHLSQAGYQVLALEHDQVVGRAVFRNAQIEVEYEQVH